MSATTTSYLTYPIPNDELIKQLSLIKHVEGGYFAETDRQKDEIASPFAEGELRSLATTIYYLLAYEEPEGIFHMNKSPTMHVLHQGRAEYTLITPATDGGLPKVEIKVIGPNIHAGESLQLLVGSNVWKKSRLLPEDVAAAKADPSKQQYTGCGESNLLSVLYITRHNPIDVHIHGSSMDFRLNGRTMPAATHRGFRFWNLYLDDHSHFLAALPMRLKSQTFPSFKTYHAYATVKQSAKLGELQDDKGGEYMSNEFEEFCFSHGIVRRHTVRNRPQQNGAAERINRTLEERIISMLQEAGLPDTFWGEALAAAVHVLNCCPTSALAGKTPYEVWHGRKPDLAHLRVWGCTAYVHVQRDKRTNLGSHMEKCVFIGYPDGYKGWKFYNPTTKRVVISERADFDERFFPGLRNQPRLSPALSSSTLSSPSLPLPPSDASTLGAVLVPQHGGEVDADPVEPPAFIIPAEPLAPAAPAAPDPLPLPAPPSPHSSRSSSPLPSPSPPPAALPRRSARTNIGQPPAEWWKARQPTPAIESDNESDSSDDPLLLMLNQGVDRLGRTLRQTTGV
ncbi:hypothetical protein EUX98_g9529 [Antrodiella citrinella]|uniref:Integrase catalytic domain-containing protein n=1 Tax=Antrodiella citrinella TaxID=2447956 RepID=A0A4S4LTP6_9APHY|nr:hypothetical protein EUX98_g9529 [Antrodiella citrinella]